MIYLVFAIIFASLFSVILKVCQNLRINTNQVILFNYATAALFSLASIAVKLYSGASLPDFSLDGADISLGIFQGLMFTIGFSIMDRSVWRSGVALTTVAARSSLILPVIFGWLILGQPAPSVLPIVIVLIALVLIILPAQSQKHEGVRLTDKTDAQRRRVMFLALIGVFLCYGISDFSLKLAQHSVESNLEAGAVLETHLMSLTGLIFISAGIFSLIICLVRGSFKKADDTSGKVQTQFSGPVSLRSIGGGLVLGVANLLCTSSSLRALSTLSTSLYYPLYNIGIVIVSTLIGVIAFKERIKWLQFAGIALSIVAIFLFFR